MHLKLPLNARRARAGLPRLDGGEGFFFQSLPGPALRAPEVRAVIFTGVSRKS